MNSSSAFSTPASITRAELNRYGRDRRYYLLVRPGITGWAQVRYGYANDFAEELEKIKYDLYYVKNNSLFLDLLVLIETVSVVLFREGQ